VRLGRADWVGAGALGVTASYLGLPDGTTRAFAFADRLRPGAEAVVAALQAQGKRVMLVSGDAEGPVAALAQRLGIAEWTAGALPAEKSALIARMTAEGARVLMVGDGLNDTAALAAAHVSISPASALDAARVASDIVLLGQDIAPVADAVRIAGQSVRRIRENFAISILYNVVAVPIALVGMATPLAAALAMSLSSITVSLNALRLK
jgi:P-type Cu2+ transporter